MSNTDNLSLNFTLFTNNQLSTVSFTLEDIGKIIQNLNLNNSHNHSNSSICMLKLCVSLTVGSYHVTYAFQSESTLYNCLNVKRLLVDSSPVAVTYVFHLFTDN